MDFVQKLNFLLLLFFREIKSEKILFGDFKPDTVIKRPENEVSTMAKKWTFFKRVVHGFCPKIERKKKSNFLLSLFFTEIMSETISVWIF